MSPQDGPQESPDAATNTTTRRSLRDLVRDPFVIAFVLGALVLTGLPFVQRLALRAPAPLGSLGAWALDDDAGGPVSSEALRGKVLLVGFVPDPCSADCQTALASFGGAARHVEDLDGRVELVSFVEPGSVTTARAVLAQTTEARAAETPPRGAPAWRILSGQPTALAPVWSTFEKCWNAQLSSLTDRRIAFMARPTLAVVDQQGSVRGFWPGDDDGRGHAINAARMFARYGTEP